jgi:hypothetical protein
MFNEEMNTDYYDLIAEFKADDETTDWIEKDENDTDEFNISEIVNAAYPENYEWTAFYLGNGDVYVIVNNIDYTSCVFIEMGNDEAFNVGSIDNITSSDDIFTSSFFTDRI